MEAWTQCRICGLKHRARADGQCPRCKHTAVARAAAGSADPTENPFATPMTEAEPVVPSPGIEPPELASRLARLCAALFDTFVLGVAGIPALAIVIGHDLNLDFDAGTFEDIPPFPSSTFALAALPFLALAIFQCVLLSRSGQTIGKKVVGIRIVNHADDKNPGFVGAVLRRICVSGLLGSVPILGVFYQLLDVIFIFGEERRCLHDLIAETKVVRAKSRG